VYHANPLIYKKSKLKKDRAINNGFTFFTIWESDLKQTQFLENFYLTLKRKLVC